MLLLPFSARLTAPSVGKCRLERTTAVSLYNGGMQQAFVPKSDSSEVFGLHAVTK
jgi:hypothetical protein